MRSDPAAGGYQVGDGGAYVVIIACFIVNLHAPTTVFGSFPISMMFCLLPSGSRLWQDKEIGVPLRPLVNESGCRRAMPVTPSSQFKGRQYSGDVILLAVRWYLRYPVMYEHVAELWASEVSTRPASYGANEDGRSGSSRKHNEALAGHMSTSMIERYSHIRMAAKRQAVEALSLSRSGEDCNAVPTKSTTAPDEQVIH